MEHINKPEIDVKNVYVKCINSFRDEDLKKRLKLCENKVIEAECEFQRLVSTNHAYKFKEQICSSKNNLKEDLIRVYEKKISDKKGPGRIYYEQILNLPKYQRCPLCRAGVVYTLDHYMPKSIYPSLSVVPINLVPACRDCNTNKGDYCFKGREDELLHPYFDDISNIKCIECKIKEENPPAFTFYVKRIEGMSDVLYNRVKNHFEIYKLNKAYCSKAGERLSEITPKYKKLLKIGGLENVKEDIREEIVNQEICSLNSWQSALYRSLEKSDWFYNVWLVT